MGGVIRKLCEEGSRANIVQISDDIFEDTEIKVSSWPELKKNYWVHDDIQKEITSLN